MTGVQTLTGTVNHATLLDSLYRFPQETIFTGHVRMRSVFGYGTDSLTFMQGFDGTGSIFAQDSIIEHGPIDFKSLQDEDAEDVGLYANNQIILWGG